MPLGTNYYPTAGGPGVLPPQCLPPPEMVAAPVLRSSRMVELEGEVEQHDRALVQLRSEFVRQEQQYNDRLDDLEAEFGQELERLRRSDLAAKAEVQRSLARALARDEEEALVVSQDVNPEEVEQAWLVRKSELDQEFTEKETRIMQTYSGKIQQLQEELQGYRRTLESLEQADPGIPTLGIELVDIAHHGGVRVARSRGAARDAGVREGDILLSLQASKNIRSKRTLSDIAQHAQPGEHLAFLVERDGTEMEAVLTVAPQRPDVGGSSAKPLAL
eukprot:RCo039613